MNPKLFDKNATLLENTQHYEVSLEELNLSRDYFPETLCILSLGRCTRFTLEYDDSGNVESAWYRKENSPYMIMVRNS